MGRHVDRRELARPGDVLTGDKRPASSDAGPFFDGAAYSADQSPPSAWVLGQR